MSLYETNSPTIDRRGAANNYRFTAPQWQTLLGCRGIDDDPHLRYSIHWKAAKFGMFADRRFIGCDVDAIDLVVGHVALDPLDRWSQFPQGGTGCRGDFFQLCG